MRKNSIFTLIFAVILSSFSTLCSNSGDEEEFGPCGAQAEILLLLSLVLRSQKDNNLDDKEANDASILYLSWNCYEHRQKEEEDKPTLIRVVETITGQ